MLERKVKVRSESVAASNDDVEHLRRAVHRLERADSKHQIGIDAGEHAEQVNQAQRRRQVATVRSEMDAREDDLFEARGSGSCHLAHDVGCWQTAPGATGRR